MSEHDPETTTPDPSPRSTPDAASAAEALKGADRLDLATIAAGLVAFVASLMPYYTVSVKGFGGDSATAWHGFFGWFGAVCALAAAIVLVLKIVGIALPVPVRTLVLGLFGLATACTLLALFVFPGGGCDDGTFMADSVCGMIDQGHGIGYWLALLSVGAGTALAAMRRGAE